ncbi:MAG: hypothetical protein AAF743_10595 [Planctomycetota bacterium]
MIELQCTHCGERMQIDDAFAGGVCRCRYCKTIQTVPSKHKLGQAAQTPTPQPVRTGTSLGQAPGGSGTGLEELGELVSSGGLGSGMRAKARKASAKPAQPSTTARPVWIWAGAGGLLVVAVLVVAAVLLVGGDEPVEVRTPGVLGLVLPEAGTVVYVVDVGPSFEEYRRELARAVEDSVTSLGNGRGVQVVLAGRAPGLSFPAGPTMRTNQTGPDLAATLMAMDAEDTSDLQAGLALAETAAADDGVIVLISGKAWQIAPQFLVPSDPGVPVYTVAVGGDHFDGTFAKLAADTGGRSIALTQAELQSAVNP